MSTYATELAAIKLLALRTLFEVLQHAKDHAELRRAATAILRIPDPKPEEYRATGPRATGCRGSARQPVPTTPDSCISQDAPLPSDNTTHPPSPHTAARQHPAPASDSVPEPEGLIVGSRGVERGSASDTPGSPRERSSHPDGVLVAPTLATPIRAHSTSDNALPPPTLSPDLLIANHPPRPAATLRAAAGAPRSLTAPNLPFSRAPPLLGP